MAFPDPITITINAVAHQLARIQTDGLMSVYSNPDGTVKFTISHQVQKDGKVRTMSRLDQTKVATDPVSSQNKSVTLSEYRVIERPSFGFSATEVDNVIQGHKTWESTANVTKLYGKES